MVAGVRTALWALLAAGTAATSLSTVARRQAGGCVVDSVAIDPGEQFNPPELECSEAVCTCDAEGSGEIECAACPETGLKPCVHSGIPYAPGELFNPSGVDCLNPTCLCDPDGSGLAECVECPEDDESLFPAANATNATDGHCVLNGVVHRPGEMFNPPDVNCSTPVCLCDPEGSGSSECGECTAPTTLAGPVRENASASCEFEGELYSPGEMFSPQDVMCPNPICTCDAGGSGNVTCGECVADAAELQSCIVEGVTYEPGEEYNPPGSECPTPMCTCDPLGSGNSTCVECETTPTGNLSCVSGGVSYERGEAFNPEGVECTTPVCTCDPNGTGDYVCTPCGNEQKQPFQAAGMASCVLGNSEYVAGETFNPPGTACPTPSCTCDPAGSGSIYCTRCNFTAQGMCVTLTGVYNAGQTFNPPGVSCTTHTCMCDANGSGNVYCMQCPSSGHCVSGSMSYAPGESFIPAGMQCTTNICQCDANGSGFATCRACPFTNLRPCVVSGVPLAPGTRYNPPGVQCATPMCVCDPMGRGTRYCSTCAAATATPTPTTKRSCEIDGMQIGAGESYIPPVLPCIVCVCDPSGNGQAYCRSCNVAT